MIKRLLFIASAILPFSVFAQPCTDQVNATFSPLSACTGKDVQLSANSISGATYSWTGPNSYTSSQQNDIIPAITFAGGGDYIVTATVGSCIYNDTVTITPNPTPAVPVATQNGPICEGDTITLMATNTPAVTYYFYWTGPDNFVALSITGQDVNIMNASVIKSGIYKVIAEVPTTGCRSDTTYLNVVVNPNITPNVFITATDTTSTGPMVPITFTANVSNAGVNPTYQWQKNSTNIAGATSQTYTGINGFDFQHHDTIGVLVTTDAANPCPQTAASNRLLVKINLDVDDYYDLPLLTLYPNPNNGRFRLTGLTRSQVSHISVTNAIGQVVYQTTITSATGSEDIDIRNVVDGLYHLQIRSANGVQQCMFNYHNDL